MASTNRLVHTWMASSRPEEIDMIVSEISEGKFPLLMVVKALEEYLTSEDDALRSKGVELLSSVLEKCPSDKLDRQAVRVLVPFYCGLLDDSETVIPALKGLVTLAPLPSFTSLDAKVVIETIFRHVRMKVFVQTVRFTAYMIIDTIVARHRDVLKAMGKDFLGPYITFVDGEKDPRNLLVVFAIARVLLIEFDISHHIESFYNIIFCYFPITFRPPPNDPYGITTDDLRLALRACISATPAFGPMAIPVFLEKLNAGSRPIKKDTLQTMASSLPVYGAALARAVARKLWNSLKLEVFQPTDPETEEEALKTTQILVNTIYLDEESALESNEDVQGFARDACEECLQILKEPEKSQARPAAKILCALISTTPSVSRFTVSQAIPHLVKLFLNPDETLNRPAVLTLLSDFIAAASNSTLKEQTENDRPSLLSPFKDEVLGVFTVGLKNSTSRHPALIGLKQLVMTKNLLSDEELGFIVHNVDDVLESSLGDFDDTSDLALDLLSAISIHTPRHVEQQTLPLLFAALPDVPPQREAKTERARCWRILSALKTLCIQSELFETLVIRLTTKLDLVCFPHNRSSGAEDVELIAAYAHSILKTLAQTLSTKVEKGHPDVAKYIDRLVPRLFNLFIYAAFVPGEQKSAATDPRLVAVAAQIIGLITRNLTEQRQRLFATALFNAFYGGDISQIAEGHQKIPPDAALCPFSDTASSKHKNLVALFSAAVISLRVEVPLPLTNVDRLEGLLAWGLSKADNDLQLDATLHLVSSVVNKHTDDVTEFLIEKLETSWEREITSSSKSIESRQRAIKAWIWISKALVVRSHPLASKFTDKLLGVFDDTSINWDAGKAMGQITAPDSVLIKENHAVIKFLHIQKFISAVLPRLISGAGNASEPEKQVASLVALAALIKSIPKSTYAHQIPMLLPLLIRGLDLPDHEIRCNVINTFLTAAEEDSPEKGLVAEHASTLVSAMLKNCFVEDMPSVRVRIAALKYLAVLPNIIRYDVLHPHKTLVIRQLAKVLDDPKRSVRKEAVDARTMWFKYKG